MPHPSPEERHQHLLAHTPRRLCEARDEGTVTVLCPRIDVPFLLRFLPQKKRFVAVRLDDLGSQVWSLLDGQRTAAQVAQALAQNANLDPEDCARRVLIHLFALRARGAVALREP
jgi:hypothetical protein